MDTEALRSCMASKRPDVLLGSDVKEGARLRVDGTPSVWINGKRLEPPLNPESLRQIFEYILKSRR
jgi:protein-disulfide isomerase